MSKIIELHGHRGARGLLPENSLPAFAKAISLGVDALELDVGVSQDSELVVFHDRRLNSDIVRDPSGSWLPDPAPTIHSLPLAKLKQLDIGRIKPGIPYAGKYSTQQGQDNVRIPTLKEVVELVESCGNHRLRFNIEAKISPEFPQETLPVEQFSQILVAAINELKINKRCIVQCFDWQFLRHVQQIDNTLPTGYLTSQEPDLDNVSKDNALSIQWRDGIRLDAADDAIVIAVAEAGGTYWCPHWPELTPRAIETAHSLGLGVITWTVNSKDVMRQLASWSVDALISDYPDRLRDILGEMGYALPDPTPVSV